MVDEILGKNNISDGMEKDKNNKWGGEDVEDSTLSRPKFIAVGDKDSDLDNYVPVADVTVLLSNLQILYSK